VRTADTAAQHSVSPSTLRVRRHRECRRKRLRLFTLEVPEDLIDQALARDLLKPEDRTDWWPVIQACYAAQLSDVIGEDHTLALIQLGPIWLRHSF
jgi:hypothetical protein